uniref:Uncharacterized protein n=1 Tax=Romanomermis culicivorax TaxID=13658 RepID=A0A915JGH8_ROMCU
MTDAVGRATHRWIFDSGRSIFSVIAVKPSGYSELALLVGQHLFPDVGGHSENLKTSQGSTKNFKIENESTYMKHDQNGILRDLD